MSAEFTDEAAQVLKSDSGALDELVATFSERMGAEPDVSQGDGWLKVSADVDYTHLQDSGAITGVGQVRLSPAGDDIRASVELRGAPDLLAALVTAAAEQPDGDVLALTMARSTHLVVAVTFPGGIAGEPVLTGVASADVVTEAQTVTVVRAADVAGAGAVVVTGDPEATPSWGWLAGGGALVAVALAAVWARRRDQADPLTARGA